MAMQPLISSSFSYRFTYDVFLSFRGEDTRYGFTGNLYKALRDRGIHTFIDYQELQRGDEITPALENAIQESRIFIIVLSLNYASSSFCLNELAHIVDFVKGKGLLVLPIFHNVDPSHVRHHRGSFGEALANHENNLNVDDMEKLEIWKMALNQVANLSGYHFKDGERYEHEFIQDIVQLVSSKINRAPLHVADYPVGLESRMLKVKALLDVGSDDVVHMVGIHGPGGIGKTTLAVAVYNSIADHFEALCFLEKVRENSNKHGLEHLQSNLLSETVGEKEIKLMSVRQGISAIPHRLQKKKVLLILDDVDKREQLEAIVGRPDWFGLGSRVVITTRNKQLLACHRVKRTYEVEELKKKDALQLLCSRAFELENFDPRYQDVLNRVVTYASGLPLALEVIGSNLFEKSLEQWESTLNRYKRIPNKDIQEVLKVSYDDLEEDEQSVFLDIACCLKEYTLTKVEDILRAHHGHCMKHHIEILVEKSLIKISGWNSKVTLHDLIEEMGEEIVRKESPKEPGKRSRLWFHEDIVQVLEENKGTSRIEIIHMDFPILKKVEWDGDAFKKMKNLKTLIIKKSGIFSKGPNHLPNSLRVLEWWGYPSQDFPNDFHPTKLAICMLPNSNCTSIGFAALLKKQKFVNLTSLNFDGCQYLTQIPDVSCLHGLENLSFGLCKKLLSIHDSVGFLEKLKSLNAEGCCKLKSFPPIKLTSLLRLSLHHCGSLESFPEVLGKMENLHYLSLQGTPIKRFPLSFKNLTGLQGLGMNLPIFGSRRLPKSVTLRGKETAVFILIISMMPGLTKIRGEGWRGWQWPKDSSLRTVRSNVKRLSLIDCNLSDEFFPIALPWFANVEELDLSRNNFKFIPECFKEFYFLTRLTLNDCKTLAEIGGIPPNLKYFSAKGCLSLTSSCRSILVSQKVHEAGYTNFCFSGSEIAEIPEWFEHCSRGLPISFRFRNKFPAIAICLVRASLDDYSLLEYEDENESEYFYKLEDGLVYSMMKVTYDEPQESKLTMIINGKEHVCFKKLYISDEDITYLFDLREIIRDKDRLDEIDETILENDWNHAEIIFQTRKPHHVGKKRILIKSGIHVLKQQSMEDIQFTDPCKNRKSEDDRNSAETMEVAEAKTLWCFHTTYFPRHVNTCKIPKNIRFTSLELAGFLFKKKFVNLTNLYFDKCQFVTEIPDVSFLQQLEILSFQWCHNLLTIHDSVGVLEKLKILNAKCCCKLKSFPPIRLTSLEQLDLASCDSLESFPKILGNMENVTKLNLDGNPINLTRLEQLYLGYNLEDTSCFRDAAIFLWNISMLPKLAKTEGSGWQDEGAEKVSSIVSSNIQCLSLRNCNLSDEFFPIVLQWFGNVKELDLSENNFRVIPESIKEFPFLTKLTLDGCKCLEEIRGIPPNLKHFSARKCISLTSSSRNMLLSQELHEDGNTDFYLPEAEIPEWFEYQTHGLPISFLYRNEFPVIAFFLVRKSAEDEDEVVRLSLTINGFIKLSLSLSMGTCLVDLRQVIRREDWLGIAFLRNEWNRAEIIYKNKSFKPMFAKCGIHVLKQQSSTEDFQLIDPRGKRKLKSQNQLYMEVADTRLESNYGMNNRNPIISWSAPPLDYLKLNCHGAYSCPVKAACGGVFRDHTGRFLLGFAHSLKVNSPIEAELLAVLHGLKIATHHNFHKLIVETDSNEVVSLLSGNEKYYYAFTENNYRIAVMNDIRCMASSLQSCKLRHIPEGANKLAHALTKFGRSNNCNNVVFTNIPYFAVVPFKGDLVSIGYSNWGL